MVDKNHIQAYVDGLLKQAAGGAPPPKPLPRPRLGKPTTFGNRMRGMFNESRPMGKFVRSPLATDLVTMPLGAAGAYGLASSKGLPTEEAVSWGLLGATAPSRLFWGHSFNPHNKVTGKRELDVPRGLGAAGGAVAIKAGLPFAIEGGRYLRNMLRDWARGTSDAVGGGYFHTDADGSNPRKMNAAEVANADRLGLMPKAAPDLTPEQLKAGKIVPGETSGAAWLRGMKGFGDTGQKGGETATKLDLAVDTLKSLMGKMDEFSSSETGKALPGALTGVGRGGSAIADTAAWARNNAKWIGGGALGAGGLYMLYKLLKDRQQNPAKRPIAAGPGKARRRAAKVTLRKPGQYNIYMDPDGQEDQPIQKAAGIISSAARGYRDLTRNLDPTAQTALAGGLTMGGLGAGVGGLLGLADPPAGSSPAQKKKSRLLRMLEGAGAGLGVGGVVGGLGGAAVGEMGRVQPYYEQSAKIDAIQPLEGELPLVGKFKVDPRDSMRSVLDWAWRNSSRKGQWDAPTETPRPHEYLHSFLDELGREKRNAEKAAYSPLDDNAAYYSNAQAAARKAQTGPYAPPQNTGVDPTEAMANLKRVMAARKAREAAQLQAGGPPPIPQGPAPLDAKYSERMKLPPQRRRELAMGRSGQKPQRPIKMSPPKAPTSPTAPTAGSGSSLVKASALGGLLKHYV